jgi:ABC-type phosphate transport system substrate-binding protein
MCLRSAAGDRVGAVNRGRRLGSLPLRVCCAVLTLWCVGASAEDAPVVPYAGSRGNATSLTRTELRDIFFARQTKWPNGDPIRVFVLPDRHPLHIRFSKEVLGVYPYQLRSTWDRILYSGTGVPPTVVNTPQEVRERVDETPGGIGYAEE